MEVEKEDFESHMAAQWRMRLLRQSRDAQVGSRVSRGLDHEGRLEGDGACGGLPAGHRRPRSPRSGAGGSSLPPSKDRRKCTRKLEYSLVASMMAEQGPEDPGCEAMFADQAIREGKGIVDLGCTDAMGGERAVDIVARKNLEKHGDTRLREVDLDHQPVYRFGNGEKERAYGRVKFGITCAGQEVTLRSTASRRMFQSSCPRRC